MSSYTPNDETLLAFLEGEVTISEAARIEAYLRTSEQGCAQLERLRGMLTAIRAPIERLEQTDLVGRIHEAISKSGARSVPQRSARRRRRQVLAAMGAAMAAVFVMLVAVSLSTGPTQDPHPRRVPQTGFRAKSAGAPGVPADRWVGLHAYRLLATTGAEPEPVTTTVHRGDSLLFAYTNLGPRPFKYLMIFSVGSKGRVHWFYPAYERKGTDPTAIPIVDGTGIELKQAIRHHFDQGPMAIYGLFTRQPLTVSQVEQVVRDAAVDGRVQHRQLRLPLRDTGQHILTVSVAQ